VLRSAKAEEGKNNASGDAQVVQTEEGLEIARLTRSAKQCRIQIDRGRDEAFADFVMDKLLDLYADYKNERSDGQ
jgi:ParB family transcriptional regulator, chromosome partitioning protein